MVFNNLIFCRTPLQSIIANELVKKISGKIYFIYYPTSDSEKHVFYFNKIKLKNKIFIKWKPIKISDTLTDLFVWWRIPKFIRSINYQRLYISSIGSIPFSIFSGLNNEAEIFTFDDGTFNLFEENFIEWIENEPVGRKIVKTIFRGRKNPDIIKQRIRHFSIFDEKYSGFLNVPVEKILLFNQGCCNFKASKNKIRVLLGTWFSDKKQQLIYEEIKKSDKFDVFLPHPAESSPLKISSDLLQVVKIDDIKNLIAEDFAFSLAKIGYEPVVYGFNSTALMNLAPYFKTINIDFRSQYRVFSNGLMRDLGVRSVTCLDKIKEFM